MEQTITQEQRKKRLEHASEKAMNLVDDLLNRKETLQDIPINIHHEPFRLGGNEGLLYDIKDWILDTRYTGMSKESLVIYEKYGNFIKPLSKQDIGKRILKINCAITTSLSHDISFMGMVYILLDVIHQCQICDKQATAFCAKCKHSYYCSKACQEEDWIKHKVACGKKNKIQTIHKITLKEDRNNAVPRELKVEYKYDKQYFEGWIRIDQVPGFLDEYPKRYNANHIVSDADPKYPRIFN